MSCLNFSAACNRDKVRSPTTGESQIIALVRLYFACERSHCTYMWLWFLEIMSMETMFKGPGEWLFYRHCWYACLSCVGRSLGGCQVTETVCPSVVRSQKSSDRFSSIKWWYRERRERTSCFCACVGGVGGTLSLPPRVDFTKHTPHSRSSLRHSYHNPTRYFLHGKDLSFTLF